MLITAPAHPVEQTPMLYVEITITDLNVIVKMVTSSTLMITLLVRILMNVIQQLEILTHVTSSVLTESVPLNVAVDSDLLWTITTPLSVMVRFNIQLIFSLTSLTKIL